MRTSAERHGATLAAWAIAIVPLLAQGHGPPETTTHEELVANHKLGQQPFDTKWIVRADGGLTQLPNPAAGGSTNRGMPFLHGGGPPQKGQDPAVDNVWRRSRRWQSAAVWLAPLLRHPGDLLGATNADYHYAKLARDCGTETLRQFLLQPGEATGHAMVRRERLDRELAIRLLVERGARAARGEIQALAKRSDDPFMRRTAQQALATFGHRQPPAVVALTDLPIAVPKSSDLWVWLDTTKLRARRDIADAVRLGHVESMWQRLLRTGRDLTDFQLAGGQFIVDVPEELPFEIARAWGRARVDHCLLAIKPAGSSVTLAWAAASGCFEPTVLDAYLSTMNVAHTMKDGVVRSDTWWPEYEVEVAPDHVVVQHTASKRTATGPWPAVVAAAKKANAGLAFEVPTGSVLKGMAWLPVMGSPVATIAPSPFSMSIASSSDEDTAKEACQRYAKLLGKYIGKRLPAAAPKWRNAFQEAKVVGEASGGVRIDVADAELDLWKLWPLLLK